MIDTDLLFRIGFAAEERGDFDTARRSFAQGAALGDDTCLCALAYQFDVGMGVEPDKPRALKLYLRAWRLGNRIAANNIAILYREKGNLRGTVRWFLRAAERGDDGARIQLAKLHLSGTGLDGSPAEALRLLATALAGNLSEEEREEAEDLIAGLKPKLVFSAND